MSRKEYISRLQSKGYKVLNQNQVSLGSLVFNICEAVTSTAMGVQNTFCLKLSPTESNMNLCPSPWR